MLYVAPCHVFAFIRATHMIHMTRCRGVDMSMIMIQRRTSARCQSNYDVMLSATLSYDDDHERSFRINNDQLNTTLRCLLMLPLLDYAHLPPLLYARATPTIDDMPFHDTRDDYATPSRLLRCYVKMISIVHRSIHMMPTTRRTCCLYATPPPASPWLLRHAAMRAAQSCCVRRCVRAFAAVQEQDDAR